MENFINPKINTNTEDHLSNKIIPTYMMAHSYLVSMFDTEFKDYGFNPEDIVDINVSINKMGVEIDLSLRVSEILDIENILEIKLLKLFFLDKMGNIIGDNTYQIKDVGVKFSLAYTLCDVLYYNLKLKG